MKYTLFAFYLLCCFNFTQAQIPNGSFEDWVNLSGYSQPESWGSTDYWSASSSVYTCYAGTPGYAGNSFLMLRSLSVPGKGVVPGVAVSGIIDTGTFSPPKALSGFAFGQRPQYLTGMYQYMASGSDQGHISIVLTKWDHNQQKRDTLSNTVQLLQGMEMMWAPFSISLNYRSLYFPDSAIITLSASGGNPANDSYLYVDSLVFSGSVRGNTGIDNSGSDFSQISLSPNPASTSAMLHIPRSYNISYIDFMDISGQEIKTLEATNHEQEDFLIQTNDLPGGIYLLRCQGRESSVTKMLVVK